MKKNVLNLDDFLSLENNLSLLLSDVDSIMSKANIYDLNEENIQKHNIFNNDPTKFELFMPNKQTKANVPIGNEIKVKGIRNDTYKPLRIRGDGKNREGLCKECNKWYRLKTSSYWYHMNYKHGINSTGSKYPEPETRLSNNKVEGYCLVCKSWICLGSRNNQKSVKFGWYRHWQKNHSISKTI